MELAGSLRDVLLLLPGRLRPQGPETSLVEEVSHLDAAHPVRGGLCPWHRGASPPDLWLLCRPQPHPNVQRLPLLLPLHQVLQTGLQEQEGEGSKGCGSEWKQYQEEGLTEIGTETKKGIIYTKLKYIYIIYYNNIKLRLVNIL